MDNTEYLTHLLRFNTLTDFIIFTKIIIVECKIPYRVFVRSSQFCENHKIHSFDNGPLIHSTPSFVQIFLFCFPFLWRSGQLKCLHINELCSMYSLYFPHSIVDEHKEISISIYWMDSILLYIIHVYRHRLPKWSKKADGIIYIIYIECI